MDGPDATAVPSDGPGARFRDLTTFRLGGPCRRLRTCPDPVSLCDALREAADAGEPVTVLGGGSNLLVSDAGFDVVVLRYRRDTLAILRRGESEVEVDGASPLADLAAWSVEEGLEGLEFATGIPGTVGGGLAVNAGAFGRHLSDSLLAVCLADARGRLREADPGSLGFDYRVSAIPGRGETVVSARFRVRPGDRVALRAERERILAFRRERHPDWRVTPTAGSFFRNLAPSSAAGRRRAAGWFLEQAGAHGMRVGGAGVYEKHANILVAHRPDCTAADVLGLARRLADAVREQFQVALVPEVRRLGPPGR